MSAYFSSVSITSLYVIELKFNAIVLLTGPILPGIFIDKSVFKALESSLLSFKNWPNESTSTESIPLFLPMTCMLNTIDGAPGPGTKVEFSMKVFVFNGFKTISLKLLSFEL